MAKILDSAPVYEHKRFTFSRKEHSYIGWASDFRRPGGMSDRLYDDACDEGFGIRSPATGKVVYFSFTRQTTHPDNKNEIVSWEYTAIVNPGSTLEGLKVVIFNT